MKPGDRYLNEQADAMDCLPDEYREEFKGYLRGTLGHARAKAFDELKDLLGMHPPSEREEILSAKLLDASRLLINETRSAGIVLKGATDNDYTMTVEIKVEKNEEGE